MAWGNQQELTKEKLIEMMGTDPAALATKLTEMGTSFEEMRTKLSGVDDIKATLARLEGRIPPKEEPVEEPPKGPQYASVLEDEDAAINGRIDTKLEPVLRLSINNSAEMAYSQFRASKPDFSAFEKDIRARWDKVPINQKVNATQLIENLYYLEKGRKVDTDGNKVTFFVEDGSNNSNHMRSDDNKGKTPLEKATDQDKVMALKWGIELKDYMETKDKMKFVGV